MSDANLQQEIQQKVLERLKHGDVRMRSRTYFLGRIFLAAALSLLVLVLSAYVLSFIAFSIHESGEQFLLGFGVHGVEIFFALFPWLAILIDIVLILILEWLLQSFKFGYRISLLLLFGVVIVVSELIASAIALTPLHMSLLGMADRNNLPVIGEMYESIRDSHDNQGIFRGSVASIQGNLIIITHNDDDHDADDGTRTIILPSGYSTSTLSIGDRVYVFGTATGTVIQALGVERLSPDQ
jgi:hypothetical protein